MASAVVLGVGLLANLAGLFKEQWVASRFGIGGELDIFAMGLALPLFVTTLIGSSVGAVVIPAYAKALRTQSDKKFVTEIGGLFLSFLLITVVLTCAVSWSLMPYMASGFHSTKLNQARWVAIALGPLVILQSMSALADGILNARSQYVASSSSTLLVPAGTLILLLLTANDDAWLLCMGLYLGISAKLFFQWVAAPQLLRSIFGFQNIIPKHVWKKHREISHEFFALMFSSVILGLIPIISQSYAAALPAGSVAGLNYANKLIGIGLLLLSSVINAVIFPILAERSAANKADAIRLGTRWAGFIVIAGFLLLAPIYGFLEPVVRLIFERGAFTAHATQEVVHILRYFLPHIPFYVAGLVLARLVVTLGISRVFVLGNVISLGLYSLSCGALVMHFGISGIGLALTLVYIVSSIYLYTAIRRNEK